MEEKKTTEKLVKNEIKKRKRKVKEKDFEMELAIYNGARERILKKRGYK